MRATDVGAHKEAAGRHAASLVERGMRVGLGTGSTVRHTTTALAEADLDLTCVATSRATEQLATRLGLRVVPPDEVLSLDLAIDGADEVDPSLHLIKGGGGAHTREKVVAEMATRFVVAVDESKLVPVLGAFRVPLEVLPFAPEVVAQRVRALGAFDVRPRPGWSDNGHVLMDADFGPIADPVALAARLDLVTGLVEHGIFVAAMVDRVIVAGPSGVRVLPPSPPPA
ncbi:MAG: ribose-5-phosphate isomerase RpiA [Sandaracinaceae bacterium]